ncbi:MAG: DUF2169 domain-containing protein [Gammaproteobacteria bacterium]|nr:DUF2169 domain-containing protein [Gammaproteobacteria bacterium]
MLQLHNSTPFAASMAFFPDEKAVDTLYLTVRATFNIGAQWTLAEEQLPPLEGDEYWGEPGESSVKYGSDYHLGKLRSDIVMLGDAYTPDGKEVRELDVSLSVGEAHKNIRIFGDREWQGGCITAAQPFTAMPLIYEKAFGGGHFVDEVVVAAEARNPVGCGFSGGRKVAEMDGEPLPNLEDPNDLITRFDQQPEPACFGAVASHWASRAQYAGTYDEPWQASRAPYLPVDFDKRFFNTAHPDLIYPGFLKGGEPVSITHMHPAGAINFEVPYIKLNAEVAMVDEIKRPAFNLETLIIEPNQLTLGMVWRAALMCDKQALKIGDVNITLAR